MKRPNNITEMIKFIGIALNTDDIETLEFLQAINSDWLQTEEEKEATNYLIETAIAKIEQTDYMDDEPYMTNPEAAK